MNGYHNSKGHKGAESDPEECAPEILSTNCGTVSPIFRYGWENSEFQGCAYKANSRTENIEVAL